MELLEDEAQWKKFLHHHGYLLHHQIGYGSFGDVFCVTMTNKEVPTKYALKRLVTRNNILDDDYTMMEIHSLLQLQHQNIVSLHEVFLTKHVACIVMELAPLGNLEMLLKNSGTPTSKSFVTLSFNQILCAISYCHGLSLAHRDINPTNILVYSSCLVKIADFGLCFQCRDNATGELILCADYLGQESYTAPEVKRCEPFHAMPADMWSLGCLLNYLSTNSRCFNILDQQVCDSKISDADNLDHVIENNKSVSSSNEYSGDNVNSSSVNSDRCECSCRWKNRVTPESLVTCFIGKLCRHSSKERLSISKASSDWKEICSVVNCDKSNNNCKDTSNSADTAEE